MHQASLGNRLDNQLDPDDKMEDFLESAVLEEEEEEEETAAATADAATSEPQSLLSPFRFVFIVKYFLWQVIK